MSLLRLARRSAITAVRLPFAAAWDVISLGNMGEGASTARVLREHQDRKTLDDWSEAVERLAEIRQALHGSKR
jgi:hypothetical protein